MLDDEKMPSITSMKIVERSQNQQRKVEQEKRVGTLISWAEDTPSKRGCEVTDVDSDGQFSVQSAVVKRRRFVIDMIRNQYKSMAIGNDEECSDIDAVHQVTVEGCGSREANGIYKRTDRTSDGVSIYRKEGTSSKDLRLTLAKDDDLVLYRKANGWFRFWYISVEDLNSDDNHYYISTDDDLRFGSAPPTSGWDLMERGIEPMPRLKRM